MKMKKNAGEGVQSVQHAFEMVNSPDSPDTKLVGTLTKLKGEIEQYNCLTLVGLP